MKYCKIDYKNNVRLESLATGFFISKSLFIAKRIRNKHAILPLRCRLLYFHKLGINRTDLPVVLRGSPTRLNINQYFRPTNPLMIIVSSWAGNAPVVNCYLWERNGGVRRCSVIWKQFESVVGGTTHCTRRSVLSNPELVLHVHVLSCPVRPLNWVLC